MKKIGVLKIEILKITWELRFWKLFKKWSFENYLKIKFEDWNFERLFENGSFWKLNLKIWILQKYLKIGVMKTKFEDWTFEKNTWK